MRCEKCGRDSEAIELLKTKLRECRQENDHLHREKMELIAVQAALQSDIFKLRASEETSDEAMVAHETSR